MKTLLIMRHAKSSWKDKNLSDMDRPLNKRGEHDAPLIGRLLRERELIPQLILCSTALRARETADIVAKECGCESKLTLLDTLYMAESNVVFEELKKLSDDIERVLIIGHNPGLEMFLQLMSKRIESLPTAALAYLALPIKTWAEFSDQDGAELVEFWLPDDAKEILKTKGKEKEKAVEKAKEKGKKKTEPAKEKKKKKAK
ncbi:MAG TPA: histidine phosphatase family protein [Anaerolineaceae bacterium]